VSALGGIRQGGKDKGGDRETGIPSVSGTCDPGAGNVGNAGSRLERDRGAKEGGRCSFEAHLEGHVAQDCESVPVRSSLSNHTTPHPNTHTHTHTHTHDARKR
jgi:hypothetical protein